MGQKSPKDIEQELQKSWWLNAQLSSIISLVAKHSLEKLTFQLDDHYGNWNITIEKR